MKKTQETNKIVSVDSWIEKSGFIEFLSKMPAEVERFNKTFGFNIDYRNTPPEDIDGSTRLLVNLGFVMVRKNAVLGKRDYCLYAVLEDNVFCGYIGTYIDGSIRTLKNVGCVQDFKNVQYEVYDWMKELVVASCNKL